MEKKDFSITVSARRVLDTAQMINRNLTNDANLQNSVWRLQFKISDSEFQNQTLDTIFENYLKERILSRARQAAIRSKKDIIFPGGFLEKKFGDFPPDVLNTINAQFAELFEGFAKNYRAKMEEIAELEAIAEKV